jgi:hypothetical protein
MITHGHTIGVRSRAYAAWADMISRCTNPRIARYPSYGGRGITVCPRWHVSFEAFLADVGEPPSPAHSLDRIDNDGNYEPGNVRWATRTEQMRNTRQNRLINFRGRLVPVAELAEIAGIHPRTLKDRLDRGWPPERAVSTPADARSRNRRAVRKSTHESL